MATVESQIIRDVSRLHPDVVPLAKGILRRAQAEGLDLAVIETFRTRERQQWLYLQGRERPGPIVTKAKPGSSWHEYGRAIDIAWRQGGRTGPVTWRVPQSRWTALGDIGKAFGFVWGGDWKAFPDRSHFEHHPGYTTVAQYLAAVHGTAEVIPDDHV